MHIVEKLAESVKARAVQLAYGDPIEANGATLVPVAFVSYGFGGGGDSEDNGGGGGGGASIPLGMYATRDGVTKFHANPVAVMILAVPLVTAAGILLSRILKALK